MNSAQPISAKANPSPSIGELEELLDGFLGFGRTTTCIVVSEPLPVPLPDKR
ncbi:hypothetical protein ACFYO1_04050 [Nocardia sp. NPDC006044]|uniref:hypothetical protein n=1 Tax=Nocardia sp. NPDC006044 TaxID=3364306 RepID=UPI003682F901